MCRQRENRFDRGKNQEYSSLIWMLGAWLTSAGDLVADECERLQVMQDAARLSSSRCASGDNPISAHSHQHASSGTRVLAGTHVTHRQRAERKNCDGSFLTNEGRNLW